MNSYSRSDVADALIQLLILTGLCFGGTLLLFGVLSAVGWLDMTDLSIQESMMANVFSLILMFAVPAVVFAIIHEKKWFRYLKFESRLDVPPLLMTLGLLVVILPFLLQTYQWNNAIQLPASLEWLELWMRTLENEAAELTKKFLQMEGIGQLLFTLFAVAVVPAITEELMFRGVLQQILGKLTKSPHIGIFLAGALFSAIHFQFYGFFPRMMLGVMLGYLFYWSGNIWYPIIAHFVNNGMQVVLVYFGNTEIEADPEMIGQTPGWIYAVIGSFLLSAALFYFFRKWFIDNPRDVKRNSMPELSDRGPEDVIRELEANGAAAWIPILVTSQKYLAEMARSVLEENDIRSVIIDKKDYAYQFGDVIVYCRPADREQAESLLKDLKNE